jgi:hypothetical protein
MGFSAVAVRLEGGPVQTLGVEQHQLAVGFPRARPRRSVDFPAAPAGSLESVNAILRDLGQPELRGIR